VDVRTAGFVVALTNKLARIAWVVLARGGVYNTGYEAVAA
jgi:hypothetical protein